MPQKQTGKDRHQEYTCPGNGGFTFLELVAVLTVIGVLAGLLFPVVSTVRTSAKRAETRIQFQQWVTAIEAFRQEYGRYPEFGGGISAGGDRVYRIHEIGHLFFETLSAQASVPTAEISEEAKALNPRRMPFYRFGDREIVRTEDGEFVSLRDRFGNTDLVLIIDTDLDGRLSIAAVKAVPLAVGAGVATPDAVNAVHVGAAVWSAGAGRNAHDIVTSWE